MGKRIIIQGADFSVNAIGKTTADILREKGCLMWFPLDAKNGLTDVIGGKELTLLYSDALVWDNTAQMYCITLKSTNTVVATIAGNFAESQFVNSRWTTITQAKRVATAAQRGTAGPCIINGRYILPTYGLNSSNNITDNTVNWVSDAYKCCCISGNGIRKIYVNSTLKTDDTNVMEAPWSAANIEFKSIASSSGNKKAFIKNFLIFDHELTATEMSEIYSILGI